MGGQEAHRSTHPRVSIRDLTLSLARVKVKKRQKRVDASFHLPPRFCQGDLRFGSRATLAVGRLIAQQNGERLGSTFLGSGIINDNDNDKDAECPLFSW